MPPPVALKQPLKYAMEQGKKVGTIFNIQRFSVHDGPGIRTTVFFKGCPLECLWCSNAESISAKPELGILESSCNACRKCADACPEGAITFTPENTIHIDRSRCTACGKCVPVCPSSALTIYGIRVTVEEVLDEINRDRIFYDNGGGITASGGEPLKQAEFVTVLFQRCRQADIGTCLDTSGYAPSEKLRQVLAFTEYVLYDLKHMDPELHRRFTGMSNELILANAKIVAASGVAMLCRIPLVAGVNDTEENIARTAEFVKSLGDHIAVEALPYHRLGAGKYKMLGKTYAGENLEPPAPERLESIKHAFDEFGVQFVLSA